MTLKKKVQLITYPDSLGANLLELHFVLRKYLRKARFALYFYAVSIYTNGPPPSNN